MKNIATLFFLFLTVAIAGCNTLQKEDVPKFLEHCDLAAPGTPCIHSIKRLPDQTESQFQNQLGLEDDSFYRQAFEELCTNRLGIRIQEEVDISRRQRLMQVCLKDLGILAPETDQR